MRIKFYNIQSLDPRNEPGRKICPQTLKTNTLGVTNHTDPHPPSIHPSTHLCSRFQLHNSKTHQVSFTLARAFSTEEPEWERGERAGPLTCASLLPSKLPDPSVDEIDAVDLSQLGT